MSDIEVPSFPFGVKFPSCNKKIILPEFHCKIYFVLFFACFFHHSNLITTAVKFSVDLNRKQENGNTRSPPSIREAKKFHSLHRFRYNSSPSELARVTVSRPYRRPSGAGGDNNNTWKLTIYSHISYNSIMCFNVIRFAFCSIHVLSFTFSPDIVNLRYRIMFFYYYYKI